MEMGVELLRMYLRPVRALAKAVTFFNFSLEMYGFWLVYRFGREDCTSLPNKKEYGLLSIPVGYRFPKKEKELAYVRVTSE
jgi:hypothetical protein